MKTSEQLNEFAAALAKAQGEFRNPSKDKEALVPMKSGGSYKYKYGDLAGIFDMIRKPMADNGLCYLQPFEASQGSLRVTTRIIHASGQWIEETTSFPLPDDRPQTLGSMVTYCRRYMIGAMLGIASEVDDDGAAGQDAADAAAAPARGSSGKKPPQERRQAPLEPPAPTAAAATGPEGYRGTQEQREVLRAMFATLPDLSNEDKHAIHGRMAGRPMEELQAVVDAYLKREPTNAAQ